MEFITTYMILNSKSHIVWGLIYFETTSKTKNL
jgi:hypothetical protein